MLPESGYTQAENTGERMPSKTYKLDWDKKTVSGFTDGKDAVGQAIKLALLTKRYEYPVFSHEYGTDYKNAANEGFLKATATVKQAITESLMVDDRILSVDGFEFEKGRNKMIVKFVAKSIFGDIEYETEVAQ